MVLVLRVLNSSHSAMNSATVLSDGSTYFPCCASSIAARWASEASALVLKPPLVIQECLPVAGLICGLRNL